MIFAPSAEVIKSVFDKKGYTFYTGNYNLNIYGIRMDDVYDNKFSDLLGIIYQVDGKTHHIQIPATTCPGLYGGNAVMNPRPEGVAVIAPGQYKSVWQFVNSYTGWLKYPYMQQIGTFNIYRDGNKDTKIDRGKAQTIQGAGLNMHRMSNNNVVADTVNNWSEGCQGSEEPYFKLLIPAIIESLKLYPNKFTYTLFEKVDF